METIKPGVYQHYKGNYYEVIGKAQHTETEEAVVVYRALYGDRGLWIRPAVMFSEQAEVNGAKKPRFTFIADNISKRLNL